MAVTAPRGPFIRAAGQRTGRARAKWKGGPRLLVIHTAEGATTAEDLGAWFQSEAGSEGSSHAGIGQTGDYAEFVRYSDTAWTAPPVNDDAEQVELCGFAKWSRAQWLERPDMLETLARWLAWRAQVRGIPLRHVKGTSLRLGRAGVTTHVDINKVWKQSSHWDPGTGFPMDLVLTRAKAILAAGTEKAATAKPKRLGRLTRGTKVAYWRDYSGKPKGEQVIAPDWKWTDVDGVAIAAPSIDGAEDRSLYLRILFDWPAAPPGTEDVDAWLRALPAARVEVRWVRDSGTPADPSDDDETANDHRQYEGGTKSVPLRVMHSEEGEAGNGGRWQVRLAGGPLGARITTRYAKGRSFTVS